MADTALFNRNMDLFKARLPHIHERLLAVTNPISRPVVDDGVVVDLDLGQGRLYKENAPDFCRRQAEHYLEHPVQVGYWVPTHYAGDSLVFKSIFQSVVDSMARHQVDTLPMKPVSFTGYVFVMGIGLGYHLPLLIDRVNAPHFVLCEAVDEFLYATLTTIDWTDLFQRADQQGKTIDIVLNSAPSGIHEAVSKLIGVYGSVQLDGSYFYSHYPLWTLTEARRLLTNEIPQRMISLGYYEDERKMVRNTATNLHRGDCYIFPGTFNARGSIPAFLVGAGPSVDDCIDTIRQWRDHVILFSSGSALQVLLKNGIIPDYHTELENVYAIHTKLQHILDENRHLFPDGKFTGITLLGSATLNPNVRQFFDRVAYFFRDAVCSTGSFGAGYDVMTGPAPTVANTSMVCAARMGFRTMYTFGFDCGWRDNETHHAKDTIYYTSDNFKTNRMSGDYILPGNFGGVVYSNTVFDWSRNILEQAIAAFNLTVFNCSDGALLKGSTPKVAEAIELTGDPIDRAKVMAHGEGHFKPLAPGQFFVGHDFDAYRRELDRLSGEITDAVAQARANDWLFGDFDRLMVEKAQDSLHQRNYTYARMVLFATQGLLKQGAVFLCRIKDQDKARRVMADFLDQFVVLHDEMFAESRRFLDELQGWINGGPEPDWADGLPRCPGMTY